jgi:aspartate aminotransferase
MSEVKSLRLSRMGTSVRESATLRQNALVGELRAAGRTVYNFTVGEPDCDTPEVVREAGHAALRDGQTRYTPTAGIPELRAQIATAYAARHGIAWQPSQVIVSAGVKQVLWTALAALVEPGDEVVMIAPYWVSYAAYVRMLGGEPRVVRPPVERDYKAAASELRAALGPRTRVVLFNTPVNPTGAVYSAEELRALLAPIRATDAVLLTDEIYEDMVYDTQHVSPLRVLPELADRTVVASGASKSFAMTGWRIGYGLGPLPLIAAMTNLQSHQTGNPCSISQRGALAALRAAKSEVAHIPALFRSRRDVCLEILRRYPEIRFPIPHGAFYLFFDVRPFFGTWKGGKRIDTSEQLADHLLREYGLAVVPGSAFDSEGGIRVSYTLPEAELRTGLDLLARTLVQRGA